MSLRHMSMSQLAEITGLDRRTVKDRLADLQPIRIEGKAHIFDAREALPYLYSNDENKAKQTTKELREQELRFERARAEKLELELEQLKGQVVPIDEVCKAVEKEFTYVRSTLLSIPSKRAMVLALESDPAIIRSLLDEDVNEALDHLQADKNFVSKEMVQENPTEESDT